MSRTGISCGNIGKGGRLINEGEDAQTGAPVSVAWAWARWIIQNNLALRNNYLKYSSLSSIFFTTVIPFPSCALSVKDYRPDESLECSVKSRPRLCPFGPNRIFFRYKERFIRSKLILLYAISEKLSPEIRNGSRYLRDCLSKSHAAGKSVHGFLTIIVPSSASQKNYVWVRKEERRKEQRQINHRKTSLPGSPCTRPHPFRLNLGSDYPRIDQKEARIGLRFKITPKTP